jgi:hypothetical protein
MIEALMALSGTTLEAATEHARTADNCEDLFRIDAVEGGDDEVRRGRTCGSCNCLRSR